MILITTPEKPSITVYGFLTSIVFRITPWQYQVEGEREKIFWEKNTKKTQGNKFFFFFFFFFHFISATKEQHKRSYSVLAFLCDSGTWTL